MLFYPSYQTIGVCESEVNNAVFVQPLLIDTAYLAPRSREQKGRDLPSRAPERLRPTRPLCSRHPYV